MVERRHRVNCSSCRATEHGRKGAPKKARTHWSAPSEGQLLLELQIAHGAMGNRGCCAREVNSVAKSPKPLQRVALEHRYSADGHVPARCTSTTRLETWQPRRPHTSSEVGLSERRQCRRQWQSVDAFRQHLVNNILEEAASERVPRSCSGRPSTHEQRFHFCELR